MMYCSDRICVQENERTDVLRAEYETDQLGEETTLLAVNLNDHLEVTELQDVIKPFVMFIK